MPELESTRFSAGHRCPYWAEKDGIEFCILKGSSDIPGKPAQMRRNCPTNIRSVTYDNHRFTGAPIPEGAKFGMEEYVRRQQESRDNRIG